MNTSSMIRALRKQLNLTQGGLAAKLGVTQQAVSYAERRGDIPPQLLYKLKKKYPEEWPALIAETGPAATLSRRDLHEAQWRREQQPLEPPATEDEARAWVYAFRSELLRDRMASLALRAGLSPSVLAGIPHGLFVGAKGRQRGDADHLGDVLFPRSGAFGIPARTVVLFGSPFRHAFSSDFIAVFWRRFLERFEDKYRLRFGADPADGDRRRRYFYFGYNTEMNDLAVGDRVYRSTRYLDAGNSVVYEDYGAILHGPIVPLVNPGASPFPDDAQRVVLVAGNHRLASGAGARVVEDAALRERVFGRSYDFEGWGAVVYRVVVTGGGLSRADRFEVLEMRPSRQARRAATES